MQKQIHKYLLVILVMVFLSSILFGSSQIINKEQPKKGTHIFPLKEIWRIKSAGETLFGTVVNIGISDSGNVFARDLKNREYYAIGNDGKFITAFGKQGEGPGMVKNIGGASLDIFKNTPIIEDSDKFLYHDDRGNFVKSLRKKGGANLFLSETEYISAPASISGLPSDQAKMRYVNLTTGEVTVIADFTVFKSGVMNTQQGRASIVMPSITPMMVFGHYKNKIYYGMNNKYTIHITDIHATPFSSFTLQREGEKISLQDRENVLIKLAKGFAPKELAIQIAKTLRDRVTCFASISPVGEYLYIYQSHFMPVNQQEIDIVTPEGNFIYRGIIKIGGESTIIVQPVFKNNHIYIVIEDEEGEIFIAKYKTEMPK